MSYYLSLHWEQVAYKWFLNEWTSKRNSVLFAVVLVVHNSLKYRTSCIFLKYLHRYILTVNIIVCNTYFGFT